MGAVLAGSMLSVVQRRVVALRDAGGVPALCFTVLSCLVFVALWWSVLIGKDVFLSGDLLTVCCLPWAAAAGPHTVQNGLLGDPMTQFLPWQELVSQQLRLGRLPLWNPYALSGTPLLANDQAAPFSAFTWLALPFAASRGMSLAMLAKVIVAAIGMALYLRVLGARGLAQAVGGVAFAASSFMVVWLQWPQSSVACLLPWAFASIEWYLRSGRARAWASISIVIALQFLAGHAETSLFFGIGVGLYALVRWLLGDRHLIPLLGLLMAAGVGTSIAGIQLLPFISDLRGSGLGANRAAAHTGTIHLSLGRLTTWLVPNGHGSPAIGGGLGPPPNYNEAVGFAGVGMLVMALPGFAWQWKRDRAVAVALAVIALVAAGTAYGPLTPLVGRLPGLNTAANWRILVLLCFAVPAFGALGVDALAGGSFRRRLPTAGSILLLIVGALGVVALIGGGVLFLHLRGGVASLWPPLPHGYQAFWVAMGAVALVAALAFLVAGGAGGHGRMAATGLAVLTLVEASLFAGPYQPRVDPHLVPPPNALTSWLQQHAGDRPIAAVDNILPPETAALYGLHDVRAYDTVLSTRSALYWDAADPGFTDANLVTVLNRPKVGFLAAAGVVYVLMPPGAHLPGTNFVKVISGVEIDAVPGARPFASADTTWRVAPTAEDAVAQMSADPLGPSVLETTRRSTPGRGGGASVVVTGREAGMTRLRVHAGATALVTIRQSYTPGWEATVDGHSTTIYPGDIAFQTLFVPPGDHQVILEYRPRSVIEGAALSLGGLLLLLLLSLLAWRIPGESAFERLKAQALRRARSSGATARLMAGRARLR